MSKIVLFVTGATGYIGGHFLAQLLDQDPLTLTKYEIRALVRSAEKAQSLSSIGLVPVLGSLDDTDILIQESAHADVILHFADADHVSAAKAIIQGLLQQKGQATHLGQHKKPILIHTSGTGVLLDNAGGQFASSTVYNDDDQQEMLSLGPEKLHRNVELLLQAPEVVSVVDLIIVTPCTIWGTGKGPGNKFSIQVPFMTQVAVDHKQAYSVGKGLNLWNHVSVNDLADAYRLLLEKSLAGEAIVGVKGNYIIESGEFAYGQVAQALAKGLQETGLNDSGLVIQTDVPDQEATDIWPKGARLLVGGNSRGRGALIRKLGWQPKDGLDRFLESVASEVGRITEQKKNNEWKFVHPK